MIARDGSHGSSAFVLSSLFLTSRNASADPVLDVLIGGESRQFRRDELLLRPDVASVEVAIDVSYRVLKRRRSDCPGEEGLDSRGASYLHTRAETGLAAAIPAPPVRRSRRAPQASRETAQ
jgi:hypothetical protein